jgi:hypothetical protein
MGLDLANISEWLTPGDLYQEAGAPILDPFTIRLGDVE